MFNDFYLNIKLEKNGIMPTRAHDSDAGLDFYSPGDYEIKPNGDILIPLQVRTEFPKGYALIFKEKSGVATKKHLSLGACVVDSEFRGILQLHLFNHSDLYVPIKKGEKIVQAIVTPVWTGQPTLVNELNLNTKRGEGGFGSTDKN
jgi:deoxyuridine 5'-triphosphate nucleotidohydrolase